MTTMLIEQRHWTQQTKGRGPVEITSSIQMYLEEMSVATGVCTVFLKHTSASLLLCENADPTVLSDLEQHFLQFAPDSSTLYAHHAEGPDDMPAHLRTVFTHSSLTIPITNGRLDLGTWQGIFLWEHRALGHRRMLNLTVIGQSLTHSTE